MAKKSSRRRGRSRRSGKRRSKSSSSSDESSAASSDEASSSGSEDEAEYANSHVGSHAPSHVLSHAPSDARSDAHSHARSDAHSHASRGSKASDASKRTLDIVKLMGDVDTLEEQATSSRDDAPGAALRFDDDASLAPSRASAPVGAEPSRASSAASGVTFRSTAKLPSYSNASLPTWPWGVFSAIQTAVDQATMESTGNLAADQQRILDRTRLALDRFVPTRTPDVASGPGGDRYRRVLYAHENDGAKWKHALSKSLHHITENLDKAHGIKARLMQNALSEMDQVDRVVYAHSQRAASLGPARRAEAEKIIKSRATIAVNELEAELRASMRNAVRDNMMSKYSVPYRNVTHENASLQAALAQYTDDNELLGAMDAVASHHGNVVRQELERWTSFLADQARRVRP